LALETSFENWFWKLALETGSAMETGSGNWLWKLALEFGLGNQIPGSGIWLGICYSLNREL